MMRYAYYSLMFAILVGCTEPVQQAPLARDVVVTEASFNPDDSPTVEFNVPDMMCPEGCGVAVEGILSKQPGAKDVLVDFEKKKAIVAIEPGKFDSGQALAALVDKQFLKSSVVEPAEAQHPNTAEAEVAKPQAAGGAGQ